MRGRSSLPPFAPCAALLLAAGATAVATSCACIEPRRLVRADKSSPRATIEAFQTYVRAGGLYEEEYRCFSQRFVREQQLSLATYSDFRDQQPWLKWFAKADVLAEREGREGEHGFDLGVAGRTLRVRLVREDFFRISRGDERVDDLAPFEELVAIERLPGGGFRVRTELPELENAPFDPSQATSIVIERVWKIDSVVPIDT